MSASLASGPTDLPILICGAGISGLALAQGLHKANIPFRVFERDHALNERAQGYRVRIHEAAIHSLEALLKPELFRQLCDSCAHIYQGGIAAGGSFDALTAEQIPGIYGANPPRPGLIEPLNADRTVVRTTLSIGLEDRIEFGKVYSRYEVTEEGITAHFADGTKALGRFLVGADGARSRVRKQFVPDYNIYDATGRLLYGKTPLTPELEAVFPERALRGLTLIQERKHDIPLSLLMEPMRFRDNEFRPNLPSDYVYWLLVTRKDYPALSSFSPDQLLSLNNAESADLTLQLTRDWHPSIRFLFTMQDRTQTSIIRICTSRPDYPRWETSARVSLMGDAAHVISPSSGVGATTALRDAEGLWRAIVDGGLLEEGKGIDPAKVREYEDGMREYAVKGIERSSWGGGWSYEMPKFDKLEAVSM